MNILTRRVIGQIILGLSLGALGTFMAFSAPTQVTPSAKAGQDYTVITVCCWDVNTSSNTHEIAIGVSEWKVTGTFAGQGQPSWEETWSTPPVGALVTRFQDNTQAVAVPSPGNSGFDPGKWLIGVKHSIGYGGQGAPTNNDTVFKEKTVDTDVGVNTINDLVPTGSGGQAFIAGNGAITCSKRANGSLMYNNDSPFCRVSTGAYGWFDTLNLFTNQELGAGLFMPLEWNVTGHINSN